MSWGIFASNMKRYMVNQAGITMNTFAKKLTTEYDACIRRGIQGINLCSIQKGNTELMESLVLIALTKCLSIRSKPNQLITTSPILKELGNAVKGYWTGATLNPFPIPPIPAPGSIQNIVVSQNICVNPGSWIVQFELPPVGSPNFFINSFILVAQIHLITLKGMIYTTSLYPSAPSPIPGPGVINWSGYVVPMGILPFGFGGGSDDDDNVNSTSTIATSDWQELSALPPNTVAKKFSPNDVYNTGDIIESAGKFYLAQNPEKNGLRCWNIPF